MVCAGDGVITLTVETDHNESHSVVIAGEHGLPRFYIGSPYSDLVACHEELTDICNFLKENEVPFRIVTA